MGIVISYKGGETQKLTQSRVQSEEYLQQYISENPECLPLDEYKDDLELLILAREFPSLSGPIDGLGIDQDGDIYIIETKLYDNPDKRYVLAQVLDYGAAMWREYEDPSEFVLQLEEAVSARFGVSFRQKIRDDFGLDDEADVEEVLESLRNNASEGNFRFVVLMDQLQDRLKDLITFVNGNSRFDVFGVELEFYRHEDLDLEILLPSLYGAEVKKTVGSSSRSSRRSWSKKSFFEDVEERLDPPHGDRIRELFDWATEHADRVSWGTGTRRGSFNPKFDHVSPRSVFTVYSDGELQVNFGWLNEPDDSRPYAERLRSTLEEEMEGMPVPDELPSNHSYVSVETWAPQVDEFITVVEDVLLLSGAESNG